MIWLEEMFRHGDKERSVNVIGFFSGHLFSCVCVEDQCSDIELT